MSCRSIRFHWRPAALAFATLALARPGAAQVVLEPNSASVVLSTTHSGSAGITDTLTGRSHTTDPVYTYDSEVLYVDVDADGTGQNGAADRTESYLAGLNPDPAAGAAEYIVESNRARRVTVVKGPAWSDATPADGQPAAEVDMVVLLPGTEQTTRDALGWFFAQYPGDLSRPSAFPTAQSSALVDAARARGATASDLLVTVVEPGRSVENGAAHQWSVYRTVPTVRPPNAPRPGTPGPDILLPLAFGDLMADVKRVIAVKDALRAANPRIGRVYLFGFSAGGSLAHRIACFFPDAFDGYGIVDIAMNASIYADCGRRRQNDGSVVTAQLFSQVGRYPVSLLAHPRPVFLVANTHSPKATNDLGAFVNGPVPNTPACDFGNPLVDPAILDSAACQEDWSLDVGASSIVVNTLRPRQNATNLDLLDSGHFDYESTLDR